MPSYVFVIGKDSDDWPVYTYRGRWQVTPQTGVQEKIEQELSQAQAGPGHPAHHPLRPERYLDIQETETSGICEYIFYLNAAHQGRQRLIFADPGPRIIKLPLNSSSGEDLLRETGLKSSDGRLASFTCDIDEVRNSALAKRIRSLGIDGVDALKIPFYLSVVDPLFQAAPWLISHDHSPVATAEFTHGGIHPKPLTLLSVPL